MQFIDIKKQYELLKHAIDEGIQRVCGHGAFIMGPEVQELEKRLAAFAGVRHALACSSGTDALVMPLMAWGVGLGDAVFTTPFTFVATAEAIALVGATPVFVDICPDTFNIDPALLEQEIKSTLKEGELRPKAVIPVDLFGLPADYDEIGMVAEKYSLKVLEDAAQGFGGRYKGRVAGSLGDVGATSFFPAKPLGCYGDGGAMFTDDDETAALLSSIRVHGQGEDKYENVRTGVNGRLDTIQAAVLLEKLAVFEEEIAMRNRIAAKYNSALNGLVQTPMFHDGLVSTWAQYSVLAKDTAEREIIMKKLAQNEVPTMVYYKKPLHLQKAFAHLNYRRGDMPVSEGVASRIFSLPMHPYLKDKDVGEIAGVIASCA
ncbi:MAG: DegT/DnrJ/EryC1/StrS family aminotransferase [Bacillota bacterium]